MQCFFMVNIQTLEVKFFVWYYSFVYWSLCFEYFRVFSSFYCLICFLCVSCLILPYKFINVSVFLIPCFILAVTCLNCLVFSFTFTPVSLSWLSALASCFPQLCPLPVIGLLCIYVFAVMLDWISLLFCGLLQQPYERSILSLTLTFFHALLLGTNSVIHESNLNTLWFILIIRYELNVLEC